MGHLWTAEDHSLLHFSFNFAKAKAETDAPEVDEDGLSVTVEE